MALDTVWLATSPSQIKQIKELWTRFVELLNWEPPLQREALAIEPLPVESLGK